MDDVHITKNITVRHSMSMPMETIEAHTEYLKKDGWKETRRGEDKNTQSYIVGFARRSNVTYAVRGILEWYKNKLGSGPKYICPFCFFKWGIMIIHSDGRSGCWYPENHADDCPAPGFLEAFTDG